MIVPTITYCSPLQANLTSTRKKCLQSFVNLASKIIAHNSNISAKLPSLESITNRHLCYFVRKFPDNETCEQFENYYELLQHRLGTRLNNALLRLPKVRTEYGKRSVLFTGAKVYNELPIETRKINDFMKFKLSVKRFYTSFYTQLVIFSLLSPQSIFEFESRVLISIKFAYFSQFAILPYPSLFSGFILKFQRFCIVYMCTCVYVYVYMYIYTFIFNFMFVCTYV